MRVLKDDISKRLNQFSLKSLLELYESSGFDVSFDLDGDNRFVVLTVESPYEEKTIILYEKSNFKSSLLVDLPMVVVSDKIASGTRTSTKNLIAAISGGEYA